MTDELEPDGEAEDYPPKPCRFWFYPTSQWQPSWWNKWGVPTRGGDEWGRRTIVWGTGLTGYICVVWRTCWCAECHWSRAQTYEYAKPSLDKQMHDTWILEDEEAAK